MRKCRWLILSLALLLAAALAAGCGSRPQEPQKEEAKEEDKLQIGLSFDSFVIERWLRDRDMFVSTAQSLGAEVNVQVAGGVVEEQISQIEYFIKKKMNVIVKLTGFFFLPVVLLLHNKDSYLSIFLKPGRRMGSQAFLFYPIISNLPSRLLFLLCKGRCPHSQ